MNETVKLWTELALSDLKSSQLLHDNKHFRTSYFFFQQAAEKANKAFVLFAGQLTQKDFKDIQHDQLKIYRKTIVKQENELKTLIQGLEPLEKISDHKLVSTTNLKQYSKSLLDSVQHIDSLRNYDLINISVVDLNYLLRQLKTIKETKIKIPVNYEKKFKNVMLSVADWVGQFETQEAIEGKKEIMNFINNKEQSKQLWEVLVNQIFPLMIDLVFINLTLYFCAIITIQHSSLSRYPDNDRSPENIYIPKLPLVKKQKEFMNYLQDAISKLEVINAT
jgi:HEPN domain-containing protein